MEKYNYYEAVLEDVCDWLDENYEEQDYGTLMDEILVSDDITGNESGSYFCSTWKAEEAICHNFDLIEECNSEFGVSDIFNPEIVDVCIRCLMIYRYLGEYIDIWNKRKEMEEN